MVNDFCLLKIKNTRRKIKLLISFSLTNKIMNSILKILNSVEWHNILNLVFIILVELLFN